MDGRRATRDLGELSAGLEAVRKDLADVQEQLHRCRLTNAHLGLAYVEEGVELDAAREVVTAAKTLLGMGIFATELMAAVQRYEDTLVRLSQDRRRRGGSGR